jgi:hypothetical protein
MNDNTYALRRQVMELIYEALEVIERDMPRVTVRITDAKRPEILGTALLNRNVIWITANACENYDLREIVYHELVHAWTGFGHDENCPLMSSTANGKLSKKDAQKLLKKYVDEAYTSYDVEAAY